MHIVLSLIILIFSICVFPASSSNLNDDDKKNEILHLTPKRVESAPSAFSEQLGLPIELLVHILSFLPRSQKELLKAGLVDTSFRNATRILWATKDLDLSHRTLTEADIDCLIYGQYPSILLNASKIPKNAAHKLFISPTLVKLNFTSARIYLSSLEDSRRIEDEDAEILAQNPSLMSLDLTHGSLTSVGGSALLGMKNIQELILYHNSIDNGIEIAITSKTTLDHLDLRFNPSITKETKQKIIEKKPKINLLELFHFSDKN